MKTTDGHARIFARRWFIAASVALVLKATLGAIGIDLLDLPLGLAIVGCSWKVGEWSGWARGYRAAEAVEPYDDWPLCPDCMVRFPTSGSLAEHHRRNPICGGPDDPDQ